ncbi:MAG: amylosucrase [Woeseiaceae bacterium]|jgi:glycosidase
MSTDPEILLRNFLPVLQKAMPKKTAGLWPDLERRVTQNFPALHEAFYALYGHRYDFSDQLQKLLLVAVKSNTSRSTDLRALDSESEKKPDWFQDNKAIGGVCYVKQFAGNLNGIRSRIPYFKSLGITYLHLMPLFECPEGRSDGGYAVSNYRNVDPALGSMDDLKQLAADLRGEGIRLVLDFVYNHTSDEHEWAMRAKKGEHKYLDYYHFFPDRRIPDQFEQTLREIFPEESPGSFSHCEELDLWVWTSFKNYQWDLNYSNPNVLRAMVEEMLFLANVGVEVLRLDAVAFAWKQMGTMCESLEQVYTLVEMFNCVARIASPALLFKSEAIVHPDEVARYIAPDRCQLSYNPLLMALLWEALATRKTDLLEHSLARRFAVDPDTQWVNYVRCHDDIGWTFSDEDAAEIGINGYDHRRFLNEFYTGKFEGSFARGLPFQYNAKTGDARVCGATASLAGLEKALKEETDVEVELAIARVLLLYSVIFSIGGIPLIYLGDELAMLNDYSYLDDEVRHDDTRWAQRPRFEKSHFLAVKSPDAPAHRLYKGFRNLSRARRKAVALGGNHCDFVDVAEASVLAYSRKFDGQQLLVLNNFSERRAEVAVDVVQKILGASKFMDVLGAKSMTAKQLIEIAPYQSLWLVAASRRPGRKKKAVST